MIVELISQRRLDVLAHCYLYYKLGASIISDQEFDKLCMKTAELQDNFPEAAYEADYEDEFTGWDGSTSWCHSFPYDGDEVREHAGRLLSEKQG